MSNDHQRLNELFNKAVKLPESERNAFLAEACGADTDLRRNVEAMLAHDPGVTQTMAATHPDSGPPEPGVPKSAGPSVFSPGDTVDKYTIIRRVAPKFGAMGEVYEAKETGLDEERRVALKVPCLSKKDDPRTLEMFTAEKQTLSRMQHPGIPKVYNVGTTEAGIPYLAMEFIEGEHLLDHCNRTFMTIPKRLELFAKICDIMRHAHLKLEAHSDLKPANILVCEEHGEPRPMVIDFGVSKPSQDPSASGRDDMPNGGTLGFTHVYASPEQLSGQGTETASDIYSLGVILYELLVGKRPFDEARLRQEFKELVATAEPITPSTRVTQLTPQEKSDIARDRGTPLAGLASTLRSELEWIPLKALRKKPEDRYESASAFGKDIRRYLNHEALEAGPESQLYRQRKWLRRHRFAVGASAAVAIALIAGIVASILFAVEATNAQADAERQKESAQRQSYMANFTLAKIYEEDSDSPLVLESLEDCQKALQTPSSSSMPFEWQHFRAKLDDSINTLAFDFDLNEWESKVESLDAIAFHPEGTIFAVAKGDRIACIETKTGRTLCTLSTTNGPMTEMSFDSNGQHLVAGDAQGNIELWDLPSRSTLRTIQTEMGAITALTFDPAGEWIYASQTDALITRWKTRSGVGGVYLKELKYVSGSYGSLAISKSDPPLLAGTARLPTGIHMFDLERDEMIRFAGAGVISTQRLTGEHPRIKSEIFFLQGNTPAHISGNPRLGNGGHAQEMAFSPDGSVFAFICSKGVLSLYDTKTRSRIVDDQLVPMTDVGDWSAQYQRSSIAFSPDSCRFSTRGKVFDTRTGERLLDLRGHQWTYFAWFSADGTRLLTLGKDISEKKQNTIKVWDMGVGLDQALLPKHVPMDSYVFSSKDGTRLTSASPNSKHGLLVQDLKTKELLLSSPGFAGHTFSMSPDERWFVSATDKGIRFHDTRSYRESFLVPDSEETTALAFTPDGRLISGHENGTIKFWSGTPSPSLLYSHSVHESALTALATSHDGAWIASCDQDGNLFVANAGTQEIHAAFKADEGPTVALAFNKDGTLLANQYGHDVKVPGTKLRMEGRIWDLDTQQTTIDMKSVVPKYQKSRPSSIDFSIDGRRIILGGKLWNAKTGALMKRVFDEEELISTDNMRIVLASDHTSEIGPTNMSMRVERTAVLETRNRSMVAAERRAAQDRSELLRSAVERWFAESRDEQKTLLDDEVLHRLEQETTTRTPDEAATLRNLTLKRFREGRFTDEIIHLEFMLEAHRQEFGPRDRKTLKTAAQIAWKYSQNQETDRAIQVLTEVLPLQREALGNEDELTLWSLLTLGDLHIKQENHEAALPFLLESLPGLIQVQGPEHSRTKYLKRLLRPALMQNPFDHFLPTADPILSFDFSRQKVNNKVEAAWEPIRKMIPKEELLSAQRLTYGNQDSQTLYTMNKLGQSLLQEGKFEAAAALLLESMTSRQSTLGPNHKATLFAIERLAELHEAWHEAEPSQGHDTQAADYRSLHEHRSSVESEDSDTGEPAQIGGTRDDA